MSDGWSNYTDAVPITADALAALRRALLNDWVPPGNAFTLLGYRPTPAQQAFHDNPRAHVYFETGRRGGKTLALLMDDLRDAYETPNMVIDHIVVGGLEDNAFRVLGSLDLGKLGARVYRPGGLAHFDNGSVIRVVRDDMRRLGWGRPNKESRDEINLSAEPSYTGPRPARTRTTATE